MAWLRRRGWLVLFSIVAVAIVGGAGYWGYRNARQAVTQPAAPPTVAVTRGEVVLSVTAPGRVVATGTVSLVAPVAARVITLNVQPGSVVNRGQVLAELGDRSDFAALVASARLQVLQAQQALDELSANAPLAAGQAQQTLAQAQLDLAAAQRHLRTLQHPDLAALQAQVASAQTALTTAQENAQITTVGDRAQALEQARAALQTATNIYQDAQRAQEACLACPRVFAPAAGRLVDLAEVQADFEHATEAVQILQTRLAQAQRADNADMTNAQTQLQQAQARLAAAQSGTANDGAFALAQADVAVAQARVSQAQIAWQRLQAGPDPMALAVAQATLADRQNALAQAQADLDSLEIRAPMGGVILSVAAAPGQSVAPGAPLLNLADPTALEVQATVVEEDFPLVQVGQPVTLFFDALSGTSVTGHVVRIVPQRTSDAQAIYPIYVQLDQRPDHLVAGMTTDGSIIIDRRGDVLRLPRAVAHARADGTAQVEVWANGQLEARNITVGLRGDSFVEILSGLAEDEQVVAQ